MTYLKVYTDFAESLSPLSDAEIGRLFLAMLEYADNGTEPDFRGNERFIWPTAKLNIDREVGFIEKQKNNGRLGGRPRKPTETQKNPNKPTETQKSHNEKKRNEKKGNEDNIPPYSPPKGSVDVFSEFSDGNPDLLQALRAFEAMRKKIRKPMTDDAKKLLVNKLKAAPEEDRIPMLQEAILHSWQSVYPLKKGDRDGKSVYANASQGESTGAGRFDFLDETD